MAELSKIRKNDVDYDIKDQTARDELEDLKKKVPEEGLQDGATFTPHVDEEGNLSWSNDKGLNNPETVNIKGETPEVRISIMTKMVNGALVSGVQIAGPKIVNEDGTTTSNYGTVWDGANGKTPVKGTDYFTDTDKSEMVSSVLAALPTWNGGSY